MDRQTDIANLKTELLEQSGQKIIIVIYYLPKTGSLEHPRNLTPLLVGSIKKCLTRSAWGSPVDLVCTLGGKVATFRARPKAPGKELESRTTKVPGA